MNQDPTTNITPTAHLVTTSAYNPYSGREALDILMKRLYNQLCAHQDFGPHLSYTKFETEFTLSFRAESIEPTIVKGKEVFALRPIDAAFTVKGTSAPAPDDGRREAGLSIPSPTLTDGGMVDYPMKAQGGKP